MIHAKRITCPYCESEQKNDFVDFNDLGDAIIYCECCNRMFLCEQNIEITYTSSKYNDYL